MGRIPDVMGSLGLPPTSSSKLTEGHKKAIVGMFANGTSIQKLAEWYGVPQAEIREVLRPFVRLQVGR